MKIPRGRGILKAKLLEEKYEAKLDFFFFGGGGGGEEVQNKKPSMGLVWIFLELLYAMRQQLAILLPLFDYLFPHWTSLLHWTSNRPRKLCARLI